MRSRPSPRAASGAAPKLGLLLLAACVLLTAFVAPPAEAAPNTTYTNRATFQGQLTTFVTDGYDAPPYPAGFQVLSNAAMSAAVGETDYQSTGHNNVNILQPGTYCAGCNGSFLLSFQTTSVGTAAGVFGVGFDITANSSSLPYHAFVTFADNSTQDFALPVGSSFFGITSSTLIRSMHLGLAGGGTTTSGSFVIDNLTIGAGTTCPREVRVYWTEIVSGKLRRANADGTGAVDLITGLDEPFGLALDTANGHVYWTEHGAQHSIKRANLDGTGIVTLIGPGTLNRPTGITLDVPNNHMYFNQWRPTVTQSSIGSSLTGLHRANLDGTGLTLINAAVDFGMSIALDVPNNRMFVANGTPSSSPLFDTLTSMDLAGGSVTTIHGPADLPSARFPAGVALDGANNHVFWSSANAGVFRSDVTGPPNTVQLVPDDCGSTFCFIQQPRGLKLDLPGGRMYWAAAPRYGGVSGIFGDPTDAGIRVANLDGTGVTEILDLDGLGPTDLALEVLTDTTPPTVTCAIQRQILWPAHNGLLPVGLSVTATDTEDPTPTVEINVYSDEPVGGPPYAPDALDVGGTWSLRAQREITGDGRVYLVVVKATDQCGNVGYACCTAVVPKAPTAFWITKALMEATTARTACQASGTGDVGSYTKVNP